MPKIKFTKFKPYETVLRGDDGQTLNEQHIRLTRSLLLSPAYKDLGKNATKILNAMKIIAKGENEFYFSSSLGIQYLGLAKSSEKSVREAIKELDKHGFIKCSQFSEGGRIPNKYKFTSDWIKWGK